jgi:lysozyme
MLKNSVILFVLEIALIIASSVSLWILFRGTSLSEKGVIVGNIGICDDNNKDMAISNRGIELIKKFEGLRLTPYLCPAGKATIGYGLTIYPGSGLTVSLRDRAITEAEAEELLNQYLTNYVYQHVEGYGLTQNQEDAAIDFIFNCGAGNWNRSTLRQKIIKDPNDKSIRDEFMRWNLSNGKPLAGLTKRRKAEADLYFSKL